MNTLLQSLLLESRSPGITESWPLMVLDREESDRLEYWRRFGSDPARLEIGPLSQGWTDNSSGNIVRDIESAAELMRQRHRTHARQGWMPDPPLPGPPPRVAVIGPSRALHPVRTITTAAELNAAMGWNWTEEEFNGWAKEPPTVIEMSREVRFHKGASVGMTTSVLENVIGYYIATQRVPNVAEHAYTEGP